MVRFGKFLGEVYVHHGHFRSRLRRLLQVLIVRGRNLALEEMQRMRLLLELRSNVVLVERVAGQLLQFGGGLLLVGCEFSRRHGNGHLLREGLHLLAQLGVIAYHPLRKSLHVRAGRFLLGQIPSLDLGVAGLENRSDKILVRLARIGLRQGQDCATQRNSSENDGPLNSSDFHDTPRLGKTARLRPREDVRESTR
jgi:hypothetical protein